MFNHVMLDLETLSSASDAAIIAIGAVRFDIRNGIVNKDDKFYTTVSAKSSQRSGGRIDADTVIWWMQQNDQARKELAKDSSVLIEAALGGFAQWVREKPCEGMWGNGSDFDNVILSNAYLRAGRTAPWPFKNNRCFRTIKSLAPAVPFNRVGTHHNALDDAITQAEHLCRIVKEIKASGLFAV